MDRHGSVGVAAAGRNVLGKEGLLAGFNLSACAGRGGTAAQLVVAAGLIAVCLVPNSTESAVANGDTRTVLLSSQHTHETGSFTYMVNGVYDQAVLDKLNWFCRDWRINESTKMDPHLFDIIWEVYRESGSTQPIDVLSGYRSPQTNAMLRRRSHLVAQYSQHMQGKAIDAHFLDVSTARIRDIAMRMQAGGVGFYPTGMTPWVHIDSGDVRYWPRMSRELLARLFPDGKTVFIPSDGKPMPGFDQARAEIEARGGDVQVASRGGGFFSWLLGRGGGADDAEERGGAEATTATASASGNARGGRGGGAQPQVEIADAGPEAVAKAKRDLPSGPAYAGPIEPTPAAKPQAPDAEPEAAAKAKGNPPIGPAYASAAESASAPQPPAKPEAVAALQRTDVASDASTDSAEPKLVAPLPPRRPADLAALALADTPLPPIRPADLILASTAGQGGNAFAPPANKGLDAADPQESVLPKVITAGVDRTPTSALALAEGLSAPIDEDSRLLARAAELTAPLPPMPIPNLAATAAGAPDNVGAIAEKSAPAGKADAPPAQHGWVVRTASLAAEDLGRLFGRLSFGVFRTGARGAPSPAGD